MEYLIFLRNQGVFAGSVTRSQQLLLLPGQAGLPNPSCRDSHPFPIFSTPPPQFSHFSSKIKCQLLSLSPQLNRVAAQTLTPILGSARALGGVGILWEENMAQLIGITGTFKV